MKRLLLCVAALSLAIASSASASTYFGFQIGVGNAPPPPRFVYERSPEVVYEPSARVYVVDNGYGDDDMFRYGPYWYVCNDGYWYRARTYRGPFAVIDVRSVPQPIFRVPEHRWRHYPPGLARAYGHRGWDGRGDAGWRDGDRGSDYRHGYGKGHDRGYGRGNGRGNDKGHGGGHGHD